MSLFGSFAVLAAEEDPTKTSSWIWPEGAEILWGSLAFAVVVYLLWKFGWPQVKKAMEARTARIQQDLDDAATAKTEADEAAVAVRKAKGDMGAERARLLAEADDQAARLLGDGRTRLEHEIADLQAKAESDLAAARSRVVAEVQEDVAGLAADAAERLVAEALADADLQRGLVEQFIARVGATAPAEVRTR
jgi:F-type H+-transporting ATPase subunit b